jgi:NAD(P)-dependent dehydrogenase (short-subunit alcohol dehydrogenase family)
MPSTNSPITVCGGMYFVAYVVCSGNSCSPPELRTASRLSAKGIRVNAILPGAIDTPMLWDNPNIKAGLEQVSKDSVGKPEDIAGVAAFLASDDASFVQGAMIEVDGGRIDRL